MNKKYIIVINDEIKRQLSNLNLNLCHIIFLKRDANVHNVWPLGSTRPDVIHMCRRMRHDTHLIAQTIWAMCVCTNVRSCLAVQWERVQVRFRVGHKRGYFFFCGGVFLGKSLGTDWNQQTHTEEVLGRHCDTAEAGSSPNVCSRARRSFGPAASQILPGSWSRPASAVWAAGCSVSAARAYTTSQILDF